MNISSNCPGWCVQTTPHGIHQSPLFVLRRGAGRWNISLGQIDDSAPHLTVVYLGEQPTADAHWHLPMSAVADYASFAARLGEAQIAAVITSTAARAETAAAPERYEAVAALYEAADEALGELAQVRP